MIQLSDFKKGTKILIDSIPFTVTDFQHVKPGKGNQFTRTKLRNLLTGTNLERTFKSGEKFEEPNVNFRTMNFLYKDESGYNFMDQTNYEQMVMSEEEIGESKFYLLENMECQILLFNDKAIAVDVPKSVNLRVVQTEPGVRGNTVTGGSKPATLETGHVVTVPLHISEGDLLKVDTRTGDYVERVNK
jgi:elongation factor P